MITTINGRGVLSTTKAEEENITDTDEIFEEEIMSDKEIWNFFYNSPKISIEILSKIEINKRGKGATKINFMNKTVNDKGPFYDPNDIHLHIWKSDKNIENFTSGQDPKIPYIQFTDFKPGLYCSICHCRRLEYNFNNPLYKPVHIKNQTIDIPNKSVCTISEQDDKFSAEKLINNWSRVLYKVLYIANKPKIKYSFTEHKHIFMWPWELSPYQKFKMSNPTYKNNSVFLNTYEKFKNNYVMLE